MLLGEGWGLHQGELSAMCGRVEDARGHLAVAEESVRRENLPGEAAQETRLTGGVGKRRGAKRRQPTVRVVTPRP